MKSVTTRLNTTLDSIGVIESRSLQDQKQEFWHGVITEVRHAECTQLLLNCVDHDCLIRRTDYALLD